MRKKIFLLDCCCMGIESGEREREMRAASTRTCAMQWCAPYICWISLSSESLLNIFRSFGYVALSKSQTWMLKKFIMLLSSIKIGIISDWHYTAEWQVHLRDENRRKLMIQSGNFFVGNWVDVTHSRWARDDDEHGTEIESCSWHELIRITDWCGTVWAMLKVW